MGLTLAWRAVELSRRTLEAVEPHLDASHLHITNFPAQFSEGPFVLKAYAIPYYFEGRHIPEIETSPYMLKYNPEKVIFDGVSPENFSTYRGPVVGEVTLHVDLGPEVWRPGVVPGVRRPK